MAACIWKNAACTGVDAPWVFLRSGPADSLPLKMPRGPRSMFHGLRCDAWCPQSHCVWSCIPRSAPCVGAACLAVILGPCGPIIGFACLVCPIQSGRSYDANKRKRSETPSWSCPLAGQRSLWAWPSGVAAAALDKGGNGAAWPGPNFEHSGAGKRYRQARRRKQDWSKQYKSISVRADIFSQRCQRWPQKWPW